ncbi:MAG TPA: hypothetical protein VFM17_06875 [Candidatus Eisenbacteria bacterium]|nr:hypothetical protein [Candidatus Eisenbacteria bacterium]
MPPGTKILFRGKSAQWDEDRVLTIIDETLSNHIHQSIVSSSTLKLVVNGAVLCWRRPAGTPASPYPPPCTSPAPAWSDKDLEWDSQGCLVVLDKRLAGFLQETRDAGGAIQIDYLDLSAPGGGGGGNVLNGMCTC